MSCGSGEAKGLSAQTGHEDHGSRPAKSGEEDQRADECGGHVADAW
jgi:hypothetical protein